ncbi:hypothetical protein MMC13_000708 [Lambiella insularis]|nr:hypothetical protein [Lambiella insularis]
MASNPQTLFHLVPANQIAREALFHPDNKQFVSQSSGTEGAAGLEIGYHIPSISQGHVITRLGRNADLILRESTLFFAQSEDKHSEHKKIIGDGVILYGQKYSISIGTYSFELIWRSISTSDANIDALKALAVQGFKTSMQRLQNVRSRDRPTEYDDSQYLSWHATRLNTANSARLEEIERLREEIGSGAFGKGHRDFHTLEPKIFMPLCNGNLTSLAESVSAYEHDTLCTLVLEQGLCGLDYLASEKLIHRDIKPDNILYCKLGEGQYLFQLADFGFARHHSLATTHCGTGFYQAPELWPAYSCIRASQSPKMDIWSLFASLVAVHSNYPEFPPMDGLGYDKVLDTLQKVALRMHKLEAMARLHPDRQASAAQLLVLFFDGRGLTTKRSRISNIEPNAKEMVPQPRPSSAARPSNPRQTMNGLGRAPQVLTTVGPPLIVYPPLKHRPRVRPGNLAEHLTSQPQQNRARSYGGVVKRQAATGASPFLRKPMRRKERPSFEEACEDGKRQDANREHALGGQPLEQRQPDLERPDEPCLNIPGMFPA